MKLGSSGASQVFCAWKKIIVFNTEFLHISVPPSLHGHEWNLEGMVYHMSRCAWGEVIDVKQILQVLCPFVCLTTLLPVWNKSIVAAYVFTNILWLTIWQV